MSNTESNNDQIGQNSLDQDHPVDWNDIWRSAKSGSGQTYTRPRPIVTLPPPSEKGWRWECHDDQPRRYLCTPKTIDGNTITILVKCNEEGDITLAPVLPAWNDDEAANWANPEVLSGIFARMTETIDKIDPATCFSVKTKALETKATAGYQWWHVRALNTAVRASNYSFISGDWQHCLRFDKAPTESDVDVPTEKYYSKLAEITLNARPPSDLYVLPTEQKNRFLAQLPFDHPSYRPFKTTD
jgi:hypothetical protein